MCVCYATKYWSNIKSHGMESRRPDEGMGINFWAANSAHASKLGGVVGELHANLN